METTKRGQRILWAVDAMAEDMEFQQKTAKILEAFTQAPNVVIEPLYVLAPDQLMLSKDIFSTQAGKFKLEAENKMGLWTKTLKLKGLLAPTVLVSDSLSLRSAVNRFLSYARETEADLIVVSTMARKGVTRFLLGSFAETLILISEIPIFVVNPKAPIENKITNILFPTDFTDRSKMAFDRVSNLARELKASVTLFHQVEYITPFTTEPFQSATYKSYLEKDVTERKKKGEAWLRELQAKGTIGEFIISEEGLFPAESIIKRAEKMKNGMIAMAAQSGAIFSSLLGSVARQVLRASPCPVWVVHTEEKQTAGVGEQLARQRARF